jgi:hypothetical protein
MSQLTWDSGVLFSGAVITAGRLKTCNLNHEAQKYTKKLVL